MVLFAHFQHEQGTDLDSILRGLSGFEFENGAYSTGPDERRMEGSYWFEGSHINIEVRPIEDEKDLVTVIMDLDSLPPGTELDNFKSHVQTLRERGLTPVKDYDLFSNPDNYHLSKYWGEVHSFIDSCRPRIPHRGDSLTAMIDCRTDESVFVVEPPNKTFQVGGNVGIEYTTMEDVADLADLNQLRDEHLALLRSLARFIQYVDVSKRSSRKPDPKAAAHLDEIMGLSYDLLAKPADHRAFTEFIGNVIAVDESDRESLYHTLAFVHNSVVLVRSELAKQDSNVPRVLQNLERYGRTAAIANKIQEVGDRYPDLARVQVGRLMANKYSEHGLLKAVVDIERTLPDSDLDLILRRMLRFGSFDAYQRSTQGESARTVLSTMRKAGFNTEVFTSDNLSNDTLAREQASLSSWEGNFHDLITPFRQGDYDVFFLQYDGDREIMNRALKAKVLSLSERTESAQEKGISYILNKVKGMLRHCQKRQAEKREKGRKIDQPLVELEEKLENLEIQLEFGGRPTGGMIYSRQWHRVPEDFSREDVMLCCAALGGDKQDLTFTAIYNPTYTYLTHFIQGIDSQLGFSILKAGKTDGKRALLSISPYEANPAIRTALGPSETHRYVLDAMVKAAHDANAKYLLIDDIDLKVRDDDGIVVRIKDGVARKKGDPGYEEADDIFIQYRNGEPCAPRSFKKFTEKAGRKYKSITHEDVEFEQICGDNELVQEQFGPDRYHYSIQSARARFDPHVDYTNFPADQTKRIFDDGYHSQNGVRTVFKIDVAKYIEERREEGVSLAKRVETIHGVPKA